MQDRRHAHAEPDVNNPTYISSQVKACHPNALSTTSEAPGTPRTRLPTSESGYFESTQSQTLEEVTVTVEKPSRGAETPHPLSVCLSTTPADYITPQSSQPAENKGQSVYTAECFSTEGEDTAESTGRPATPTPQIATSTL